MRKISIIGSGAMGCRIGSQLSQAGYSVTLIDTWEDHVQAIREKGLEVQTETDTYSIDIPVTTPNEVNESFDLAIVLTKSMQSEEVVRKLYNKGAITHHTAVLSMMNGLGHDERLSKIVPHEQIFLAVTMWTAGLRGPGKVLLEGIGSIELQRADGQTDERTERIAQMLNDAQLNAKVSDDIFRSIWSKATLNSVLNPLCTIFDKTIYEFSQNPIASKLVHPLVAEIVQVATSRGVHLDQQELIQKIENAYPKEAQGLHYPSMHQDLYNGRYTEIDYLNGQISKYGDEADIDTPYNDTLTFLIHQYEFVHIEEQS